jgi:hypothetical protein
LPKDIGNPAKSSDIVEDQEEGADEEDEEEDEDDDDEDVEDVEGSRNCQSALGLVLNGQMDAV